MSPRIRSFVSRPFHLRAARPTAVQKAPEAPKVFREFVEALQRLDAAAQRQKGAARTRAFAPRRARAAGRHPGNGHVRPRARPHPQP